MRGNGTARAQRVFTAPVLERVRVRSYWYTLTHEDGNIKHQQRVYEVRGPTGYTVVRTPSFAAAIRAADVESRRKEWRDAAGVHECTKEHMARTRHVSGRVSGMYCGHGRFLGPGDTFTVDGVPSVLLGGRWDVL